MKKVVKTKAIFDGTGNDLLHEGCLLINDGIIESVGRLEEYGQDIERYSIIDLSDYYIMPGLIDSHTHLSIDPSKGDQLGQLKLPGQTNILRSMPHMKKDIASGVTTMRIMGEEHYIDIDIRNAIQQGLIEGPRLLISGKGLVPTNGHGVAWTVTDGVEEVRKRSRENLARGADFIKIFATGGVSSSNSNLDYSSYSNHEVATAVEEAERVGKYVAAHAHGGKGLDVCIEEGVRTIEHAALINDHQLDGIMKKNLWIIGTFSILFHPTGIEKTDFVIPNIKEKLLKVREEMAEKFSQVIKSGANLALGTDSMHGLLSYELECLVNFGASNKKALLAITQNAAKVCRIEDQVGTLEKGKFADFIALKNNPLEDVKHLKNVEFVYKEGKRI